MSRVTDILARWDSGEALEAIAAALNVSRRYVYAVLAEHRPGRERKKRECTSDKPRMIAGLAREGVKPARVAELLKCSRAYVYRHWPEDLK